VTDAVDERVAPTRVRRRRRLIVAAVVAGVLGATGLAVGITLAHLDGQYGPVQRGEFGGPYSDHGFTFTHDGFRLSSDPAATGRVFSSLDNLGAHSVEVSSIDLGLFATDIRWSVYRVEAGGPISGVGTSWHPFPAIIPSHGTIRLLITLHRSSYCSHVQRGSIDGSYFGDHDVHWESLLGDRTTHVELFEDDGIGVC
jgi:hypothetical protein